MYRPAGPTWKISKRTQAEIREIHRTLPVMLLFLLAESDVDGSGSTAFMSGFGRTSYEDVITPGRALSCRYPVNCVAVWPRRSGNVANHTKLFHLASQRHGPGAKPGGEATSQAGAVGKHWCRSPDSTSRSDVRSRSHSDGTACAGFGHGEACPARENQQQLHRWLPNKFQVRQPTLEWLLRIGG
jgi:hypothetical protein